MNLEDLLEEAPNALNKLTGELFRRGNEEMLKDNESQLTACLQLGLRSASIMHGMIKVLGLPTIDSYETLNRATIEARDLLMHFRISDKGTKEKIGYWFAGAKDNAWKADHKRLEEFLLKQDLLETPLGENWSKVSGLTHPTKYASDNSTVVILHRLTGRLNGLDIKQKQADYFVGIARLFLATAYDVPGWISLGLNYSNLSDFLQFCHFAESIGGPIVNARVDNPFHHTAFNHPRRNPNITFPCLPESQKSQSPDAPSIPRSCGMGGNHISRGAVALRRGLPTPPTAQTPT